MLGLLFSRSHQTAALVERKLKANEDMVAKLLKSDGL